MKMNALISAVNEICQERSLDRDLVIATIEEAILIAARKKYLEYENLEVGFNDESGEFELTVLKEVVDVVSDPENQVSLSEMQKLDPDTELGDFLEYKIEPEDFKNVIAQTTRVMLFQKIKEIERESISQKYSDKVKTIVHGKVGKIDRRRAVVLLNDNAEAILEYREQIPNEKLHSGENIRALLINVKNDAKGPQLFLSRTHPDFLRELFDQEIPEVYEGLINVVSVARDPGRRAKIAVSSNDTDIDPVGSCVGPKGSRIQPIVSELCGERIDIIEHTDDVSQFIRSALSPGQVVSMTVDTEERVADVDVDPESLSVAIGKQGQNVKLASILTKYTINVMPAKSDEEEEKYVTGEELGKPEDAPQPLYDAVKTQESAGDLDNGPETVNAVSDSKPEGLESAPSNGIEASAEQSGESPINENAISPLENAQSANVQNVLRESATTSMGEDSPETQNETEQGNEGKD